MTKQIGTNQLFPLLKYMINILYHPSRLLPLELMSWPRADKGYDMKNAM